MNKALTFKEKMACKLLAHLKHNETEFIKCTRNDLIFLVLDALNVDGNKLFQKLGLIE